MKRDMDLARKILQQIEEKSDGLRCESLDLPDHSRAEIAYHLKLLKEARLIEGLDFTSSETGLEIMPKCLTWQGHEFLDAIKNDTVWNKVKETVKEKGGAIPFEILKAFALQVAKGIFGIS